VGAILVSGLVLGLSAGLSPGPILTLVIFQTLRHGIAEGVKVSLAPLVTDIPIIMLSLLVLSRLSNLKPVLGMIAICGGIYLFYLGYESLRFKGVELSGEIADPQSLKKGVIANFLNPNPYLFWISIGGPLVIKAGTPNIMGGLAFMIPFYTLLVGSKCAIAMFTGRSRGFLKSGHYIISMRLLGIILFLFGIIFLKDGITYLGFFNPQIL
jgi:threonine/homoserine/homoserine lactone efflux protein